MENFGRLLLGSSSFVVELLGDVNGEDVAFLGADSGVATLTVSGVWVL